MCRKRKYFQTDKTSFNFLKRVKKKHPKFLLEDLLVIQTSREELQSSLICHNALEQKSFISEIYGQLQAD